MIRREKTEDFKIFTENSLKIYNNKTFFDLGLHFGRYHSIYLDFKSLSG